MMRNKNILVHTYIHAYININHNKTIRETKRTGIKYYHFEFDVFLFPFNAIIGIVNVLNNSSLDISVREILSFIHRNWCFQYNIIHMLIFDCEMFMGNNMFTFNSVCNLCSIKYMYVFGVDVNVHVEVILYVLYIYVPIYNIYNI